MTDGDWISLFSGGKDSSWALYRALESGRTVTHLVTVHPADGSFLYHVPATEVASLAAESIGIPLVEVEATIDISGDVDSARLGDRELEPLEATLAELTDDTEHAGYIAGAVESRYQRDRLRAMGDRLGLEPYTPLWQTDPFEALDAMLEAGFEIVVVAVAAEGFDESWLGRILDGPAVADLRDLRSTYGVHPLGEGGEYETLVTDGPHMARRIDITGEPVWEGSRGELEITDVRLG